MNRHHVLTWESLHLEFDSVGDLVGLGPAGGERWVTRWQPAVRVAGAATTKMREDLSCVIDADEVEQRWRVPQSSVQVRVRHTFDRTWHVRMTLRNTGSDPVDLHLRWEACSEPMAQLGLHAAGARATCRIVGPGDRSVLQGVLVQGSVGPNASSRIRVEAGATHSVGWRFDRIHPQTPPPLPAWWPETAVDADEPVLVADQDVVVPGARSVAEGWEVTASAGVQRFDVVEATRVTLLEVYGAPGIEEITAELGRIFDGHDALSPAEAVVIQAGERMRGVPSSVRSRLRVGTDDPGLRRLLGEHCAEPGFGHGLATLHGLAAGDPSAGPAAMTPPPSSPGAGDLEQADRLLLVPPDAHWEEMMRRLRPVVDAWPIRPWGWSLVDQARWVAVASMARQLGRPGVGDPGPLRRSVLASCQDAVPSTAVAALAWLLV